MLAVLNPGESLAAVLSDAANATNPTYAAVWHDVGGQFNQPAGSLSGATAVTLVPAPTGEIRRIVERVDVRNADDEPVTVTIARAASGVSSVLGVAVLQVGDMLTLDANGLRVVDSSGQSRGPTLPTQLDVTAGTVSASKSVVVDADKNISGFGDVALTGTLQISPANEDETVPLGIGSAFSVKRFHATVTLATDGAETAVGLTPNGVILGAAIRVSTAIAGLDSADHHIQLGVSGTADKYIDVANGSAATSIAKNKKGTYVLDGSLGSETDPLVLTITGGSDATPSAGAVEVEVIYLAMADLEDVA